MCFLEKLTEGHKFGEWQRLQIHRQGWQSAKVPPAERKEQARRNELAAELTNERARAVRANRLRSEMLLAKARNELIEGAGRKQPAWLLIAFRQRLLAVPQAHAATPRHHRRRELARNREMGLSR